MYDKGGRFVGRYMRYDRFHDGKNLGQRPVASEGNKRFYGRVRSRNGGGGNKIHSVSHYMSV